MANHILIDDQGNPKLASKAAVMERAKEEFGGISFDTLKMLDASDRTSVGIWLNAPVESSSLLAYQRHSSPVPMYDGNEAWIERTAVDIDVATAQAQALQYLSAKRWSVENGGVPFGGSVLDTSRENRANYVYNRALAIDDDQHTISNWKIGEGLFIDLDAATIIAASDLVAAHVQACYNREAELSVFVQAAVTLDDLRAIDLDAGWPANEPPEA